MSQRRRDPGFLGDSSRSSHKVSLSSCLSVSPDLPLRQVVGEECVAFMLNWRENDYLTLQVPPSLVMNNPYIKVGPVARAPPGRWLRREPSNPGVFNV